MSGFQRGLPIAFAVMFGVIGGVYTFQPVLASHSANSASPSPPTERRQAQSSSEIRK